jgi:DNA-directed RNA polymerase subunit L
MRFVHVQSVLPEEDVLALKIKTGENSVKEALSKAVYYYLENCNDVEVDKIK